MSKYSRGFSISPQVRSYERKYLTPSRDFQSPVNKTAIFDPPSVSSEYKNYILRFKNSKSKLNYWSNLDSQIHKVKKFNHLVRTQKQAEKTEKNLKVQQEILLKLQKEAEVSKEIQEKARLEQEKILAEKLQKEQAKVLNMQEWMKANSDKFEAKRVKIRKDLENALNEQRLKAEKKERMNKIRYKEILDTIGEGKDIVKDFNFVNTRRNVFLHSIQLRSEEEGSNPVEKLTALDRIKEKLSNSITIQELNDFFCK